MSKHEAIPLRYVWEEDCRNHITLLNPIIYHVFGHLCAIIGHYQSSILFTVT